MATYTDEVNNLEIKSSEKSEQQSSETTEASSQKTTIQPGSDEGGEEEKSSDDTGVIPYKRFAKVNSELKAYKSLGFSPEELKEVLEAYEFMLQNFPTSQTASSSQKPEPEKEGKGLDSAKRAQLLDALEQLIPGISRFPQVIDELKKSIDQTTQNQQLLTKTAIRQMNTRASQMVESLLEELGYRQASDEDVRFFQQVEEIIANDIYTNPQKRSRYLRGDLSVVEEVFEEWKDFFSSNIKKRPIKPTSSPLPFVSRRNAPVGKTSVDDKLREKKPLTSDEMMTLHKEVWKYMQEVGAQA